MMLNSKGCDASNIYDEENIDVDFSDDEKEATHKGKKKDKINHIEQKCNSINVKDKKKSKQKFKT